MKKLIFCLQRMTMGGVEKELITVLKKIHADYRITLLLLYQEEPEMLAEIPDDVTVTILDIDKGYYCSGAAQMVRRRLKKGKLFEAASLVVKQALRIGMVGANLNLDGIPSPEDSYDAAICYHIHSPIVLRYVAEKIQADKKVAWIHNDFFTTGYPIHRLRKYVEQYDEFVAVSKKVENEFRECCPWYQGGISTAYNYMDADEILALSEEPIEDAVFTDETDVRLLTVGRFAEQKGIDLAIEACAMLKKKGLAFHWFLIGYGEQENEYRRMIDRYDVADRFTILGKRTNPYSYMKQCDICVQPSRHEAYPLVILEAKILRKPIVCTDFDGADEQIENGKNGIIVPLNDVDALCEHIAALILSGEKRQQLSAALAQWQAGDDLREIVKHFG